METCGVSEISQEGEPFLAMDKNTETDRLESQFSEEEARWEKYLNQAPVLRLVGNTPMVRLQDASLNPRVELYAKMESFNPGGSVKDRPALHMVKAALLSGELRGGKVLLDSTSGNTGIAYAMIGAALGFPVELCLPQNASEERKALIQAYGTHIHFTDPLEGSEGARIVAQEMYEADPEKYFLPDQYNNENNPKAHYETTGPEIWEATEGRVTHFLAGIGTSGRSWVPVVTSKR